MFKIGDFSKLSQVTVKALRYYDEIGLLKPANVDQFTAYRYYSADQFPRLNRILTFKDLGFSLDQIARLLDEELSPAEMRGMLRMRQMEIQHQVAEEQAKLARVEIRLRQMEQEGKMPEYDVVIKTVETLKVASTRSVIPTYSDVGTLFGEVYGYLMQSRITPAGPPMAIYHDPEYKEENVDVEAAVPLEKQVPATKMIKMRDLPGAQVANTVHHGGYDSIGEAYNTLMKWIGANGYRVSGPCREVYLKGPDKENMDADPSEFVTEVQCPVEKA